MGMRFSFAPKGSVHSPCHAADKWADRGRIRPTPHGKALFIRTASSPHSPRHPSSPRLRRDKSGGQLGRPRPSGPTPFPPHHPAVKSPTGWSRGDKCRPITGTERLPRRMRAGGCNRYNSATRSSGRPVAWAMVAESRPSAFMPAAALSRPLVSPSASARPAARPSANFPLIRVRS